MKKPAPNRAAGGKARAAKLSPERRREIASMGGKARGPLTLVQHAVFTKPQLEKLVTDLNYCSDMLIAMGQSAIDGRYGGAWVDSELAMSSLRGIRRMLRRVVKRHATGAT